MTKEKAQIRKRRRPQIREVLERSRRPGQQPGQRRGDGELLAELAVAAFVSRLIGRSIVPVGPPVYVNTTPLPSDRQITDGTFIDIEGRALDD